MKPIRYLSVCSGIEAATVAWHPLGFTPAAFSEIDPFASALLSHHYPHTTNHGDLTQHRSWPIERGSIDLLVSGTPCQSFSIAGLRKGLADPRGNLCLEFIALADRLRPRFILWENVVGVLSSNRGEDFAAFISALAQIGYGFAWRVCDSQFFGVPQQRRRLFLLAIEGSGNWRSAAEILFEPEGLRGDHQEIEQKRKAIASSASRSARTESKSMTLFDDTDLQHRVFQNVSGTLRASRGSGWRSDGTPVEPVVLHNGQVRALTPREWERVQGFPDDYTMIPWNGKPADRCPDGLRYKSIGNSFSVPVVRWIGERINLYHQST